MKALLDQRAKAFDEARAYVLAAETAGRSLTGEEYTEWRKRMDDVESISRTMAARQATTEAETNLNRSIGPRRDGGESRLGLRPDADERGYTRAEYRAFQNFALPADQRRADAELPNFGQVMPGMTYDLGGRRGSISGEAMTINLRAASPLSDVTGAAGAYTVPAGFVYSLEKNLKWFGGVRAAGPTILPTATGNPLPWPTMDDTYNTGEQTAENTAVNQAGTEMAFGQVNFGAYKYDSQLVKVPIELIQDSAFNIQSIVFDALGQRIGRKMNTVFTLGTGSNQPTGVVPASTSGTTGAVGQTGSVIYDNFVDLEHSVDPWYRANGKYMMHDSSAAVCEKLKDNNGRPLLNSSFAGINADVFASRPDGTAPGITRYTIKGYQVVVNNDMATMAANAKSILFGDFSKYVIRDVMEIMLIRFNELYMGSLQVGFLAVMRADGQLVDAGAHPIRYYSNSAT